MPQLQLNDQELADLFSNIIHEGRANEVISFLNLEKTQTHIRIPQPLAYKDYSLIIEDWRVESDSVASAIINLCRHPRLLGFIQHWKLYNFISRSISENYPEIVKQKITQPSHMRPGHSWRNESLLTTEGHDLSKGIMRDSIIFMFSRR